jgi:plastocyanin
MRLVALATLVLAVALAGCGGDDDSSSSSGGSQTIEISLTDFALEPSQVSVEEPGTYTFRAVNDGQTVHALEVEGNGVEEETEELQPGDSAELTVELTEAGDYELYCPVGNHRGMGMEGSLQVGGAAGAGAMTDDDEDEDDDSEGKGEGDGYGSGG